MSASLMGFPAVVSVEVFSLIVSVSSVMADCDGLGGGICSCCNPLCGLGGESYGL